MTDAGPRYKVPFRRRREGRTDYRHRARLLRSGRPRAVVRKTLQQTIVQIIEPARGGDAVLATATSRELVKQGWTAGTGNVPAAYLTGYLAGRRALAKGVTEAVLDVGLHTPTKGGRLFAALQGLLDSGVRVPHGKEVLPSKERLHGAHIDAAIGKSVDEIKAKLGAS
jgi:large subunit ribosomal protein L18